MDPLSAGIGAAGSLLGGFFTHNYNRWMLKQQMKYNTAEREASQDWQNQQREAQNQFSEDMYNKYSSPQALVSQYQAAGLNPRLAVDGGQVGSVQASSGSSGSAPSGAMASMPYQQSPDFTQGFVNMANVLKSIAEARKAGAETDKIEKMLNVEFDRANIAKEAEQFALGLNIKYQDKERFIQLAIAMNQEGITAQERKNLEEQFKALCYDNDVRKFNVDKLVDRWFWEEQKNIVEVGQGQANVVNTEADTALKRAETVLAGLKAVTEKEMPEYYKQIAALDKELAEFKKFDNELRKRDKKEIQDAHLTEYMTKQENLINHMLLLKEAHKKAIQDRNFDLAERYFQAIGAIGSVVGGTAVGVGVVTK